MKKKELLIRKNGKDIPYSQAIKEDNLEREIVARSRKKRKDKYSNLKIKNN